MANTACECLRNTLPGCNRELKAIDLTDDRSRAMLERLHHLKQIFDGRIVIEHIGDHLSQNDYSDETGWSVVIRRHPLNPGGKTKPFSDEELNALQHAMCGNIAPRREILRGNESSEGSPILAIVYILDKYSIGD